MSDKYKEYYTYYLESYFYLKRITWQCFDSGKKGLGDRVSAAVALAQFDRNAGRLRGRFVFQQTMEFLLEPKKPYILLEAEAECSDEGILECRDTRRIKATLKVGKEEKQ